MYNVTTLYDNTNNGSLRAGILFANKNPNATIIFDVNGEIKLNSSLPHIINPTSIIGNLSSDGNPLNTINGNGKYNIIEIFKTEKCMIRNICLINSKRCGIFINKASFNEIYNCRIGIDTNNNAKSNKYGIVLLNSTNNIIGSNTDSIQTYFSNVVSGNKKSGIQMINSTHNTVANNIIGLSSDCAHKISNGCGMNLIKSEYNIIGGKKYIDNNGDENNPTGDKGTIPPNFVRPLEGNIISGNKNDGILLKHSNNNNFFGNFIGTDNTGLLNFGNGKNGVRLMHSNTNTFSGCGIDSNPFIYYNVIGFNKKNGILVHDSCYTTIQGNFFGICANNDTSAPNLNGLKISGNSKDTSVGGIIPIGNVVSGNTCNGIHITGCINGFETINTFCGIKAFGDALANGSDGMLIDGNAKNIQIHTNVISGNGCNGICIKGNANNVFIGDNIIGMNTLGMISIPNEMNGIKISENAHDINDGASYPSVIRQNTISSNGAHGILLEGNVHKIIFQLSVIGLAINRIGYKTNTSGGILIKDTVHNCEFGNSLRFLFVHDENNFAIKLDENTHDNVISYCMINTNMLHDVSIHNENINNLSNKNHIFGNALPV